MFRIVSCKKIPRAPLGILVILPVINWLGPSNDTNIKQSVPNEDKSD